MVEKPATHGLSEAIVAKETSIEKALTCGPNSRAGVALVCPVPLHRAEQVMEAITASAETGQLAI